DMSGSGTILFSNAVADAEVTAFLGDAWQPVSAVTRCNAIASAVLTGGTRPFAQFTAIVQAQPFSLSNLTVDPALSPSINGLVFWSECSRCGDRYRHRDLSFDGQKQGALVCRYCWDPKHGQEIPFNFDDEYRETIVAPEVSVPALQGHESPQLYFDGQGNP